ALQILSADGNGRVLDPLFPNGEQVDFQIFSFGVPNSPFGVDLASQLTQSPTGQGGSLVGGGIDDRFDFILQSDELLDGEGVASIDDSLRAFGNNGSTPNTEIHDGNTIQIDGLTSFTTDEVLDALEAASDHLPVITDFQIPAVLDAMVTNIPPQTLLLDEIFDLSVLIENGADVSVAIGADELEFQLLTTGDLIGSDSGIDLALGGGFESLVRLDTSQIGSREGEILISSNSPSVANGFVSIPISFNVIAVAIPEPAAWLTLGGITVAAVSRRRRMAS
ncbi:MAG: hypothetical protein AAF745_05430, partial [Planctomycetota bacterium]